MNCSFGDATQTNSYQIIGLPGSNNLPIADVMAGSPGKDGDWRAFMDSGTLPLTEYNGSSDFNFKPGVAFWVISKNSIQINNTVNTVPLSSDNTYSIPLHNEWNLISNPFDKTVSWSSVESANGITQPIHYYQTGIYTNPTGFEAYKGYYFYNSGGLTSLKIPYNTSGTVSKQISLERAQEIEIELKSGKEQKAWVKIGYSEEANPSFDKMDIFSPPSGFCEVSMSLYNSKIETNYKYLQKEYRDEIGWGQEYNVEVKNMSKETLELKAEGLENLGEYGVYLLDKSLMKLYDLRRDEKIEVKSNTSGKEYNLYIGTGEYIHEKQKDILPVEYTLYQNYPNPFNPSTTIRFALPQQSKVSLKIYNILGELIKVIINDQVYEEGYHEILFNGSLLPSGVYIYKLTAGDFSCIKKMMIIK